MSRDEDRRRPSASDAPQSGPIGLILRTGLIASTLDITDSLIFNEFRGITPTMVFHYIASGLFGIDKALQGGRHRLSSQ